MNPTFPWLSFLIFLPLVGALLCLLRRNEPQEARALALTTALAVLAIAGWLFIEHGGGGRGWLLYEDVAWITRFGIRFTLGLDGFGLVLILLTAFLQVVALLASWTATRHIPFLFALLLAMESGILGVFLALDLILFYAFWELMLIPMFLLINIWGHERRHYAAIKFFLFTLAGSLLMLLGIIALYLIHGAQHGVYTFALAELAGTP
jgi:NADH-quinone oxidoreductase subunit M